MERVFWVRLFTIGALLSGLVVLCWPSTSDGLLRVRFLDVGQGDAILIQTPDGVEMLVDGGAGSAVLRSLGSLQPWYDRTIDVVVATHPDTDHLGGLVDVLTRYEVANIWEVAAEHDVPAADAFSKAAALENASVYLPQAGDIFRLGASTTVQIFSPQGDTTNWQSNNASIVLKIQYGDIGFLLSGDAPTSIENYLAGTYGAGLEAEVLKLGHHGSKTSTSDIWLDAVTPQYAVISAGLGNRYGHPNQEVMGRVFARNITTFSTMTEGTITFATDGKTVWKEE
ncbi:MBL fold metallo-hydrolase [Candidatus Kaiserbacteria bacterium]|nr:MBL fold metallo-hydrolase [Candidatus Kaiserbacteria bacterium]